MYSKLVGQARMYGPTVVASLRSLAPELVTDEQLSVWATELLRRSEHRGVKGLADKLDAILDVVAQAQDAAPTAAQRAELNDWALFAESLRRDLPSPAAVHTPLGRRALATATGQVNEVLAEILASLSRLQPAAA